MASNRKITQILFHISDGLNYTLMGVSLILAATTPFSIQIMSGFEGGAHYTTSDKLLIALVGLLFATVFWLVTRHSLITVTAMILLYVISAFLAANLLFWFLLYILATVLPYALTLTEILRGKAT